MRNQLTMFETELTSVANSDGGILSSLIGLHAPAKNPIIADCTYGNGRIWKGCEYQPDYRFDQRRKAVTAQADFRQLPIKANTLDVLVFDPPHLPGTAKAANYDHVWADQYGIDGGFRGDDNVAGLFAPFLQEARRVLYPGGLILAKLADIIHNHAYQWQQVAFVVACSQLGLKPIDMAIKVRKNPSQESGLWERQYHLRRRHSYWIAVQRPEK